MPSVHPPPSLRSPSRPNHPISKLISLVQTAQMQLRSLHPAERADIGAAGPAAGVLQLTVKQPPEGDTALELGRKYDGVRVLSIRPPQTRKVLKPHAATLAAEAKYRTAQRPQELRVVVQEPGKRSVLRDGVVGSLETATAGSVKWRKANSEVAAQPLRQIKRQLVDKDIGYNDFQEHFKEIQVQQARAAKPAPAPAPAAAEEE